VAKASAVALLSWGKLALAGEPAQLELAWVAPPECPSAASVREEALRLASTDDRPLPRIHARVTIEHAPDTGYLLTLTTAMAEPGTHQTVRADTCAGAARAAAVTLALILNPVASRVEIEPRSSNRAVPQPKDTERSREQSIPVRWAALGLVGVQYGLLPKVGPTLGAELGGKYGPASAWLGVAYGPSQRAMLEARPALGGELSLVQVFGHGCWALVDGRLALNLCAGLDFSRVAGRGLGVTDEKNGAISWLSAFGGPALELPIPDIFLLRLETFASAPLHRPRALLEEEGDVYRPGRVSARIHAGVGAALP
jgi:hypothetical protein